MCKEDVIVKIIYFGPSKQEQKRFNETFDLPSNTKKILPECQMEHKGLCILNIDI